MQAASRVLGTVVGVVGLAVLLPALSSAGSITIVDGANDIISFIDSTGGRLNSANCAGGSEALSCFFSIAGMTGAVTGGTTLDHAAISLLEPGQPTVASDNLRNTDFGTGGSSFWNFASDAESGLTILTNAFTFTEDGTPQLAATITYHSVTGAVVGTDQIFVQSDLEPVPEPASASLLVLGAGLLIAAGRWRKRIRG
jgi:hypothetical protein